MCPYPQRSQLNCRSVEESSRVEMGNSCECVRRQSSGDEAEDALLASLVAEGTTDGRPRGPPPPYQVRLFEYAS